MKTTTEYNTTVSISKQIGCSPDTVGRIARANEIGTQLGGVWIFTSDEADKLAGMIRESPGRPAIEKPKPAVKRGKKAV